MDIIYRYDPFAPLETRQVPDAKAAIKLLTDGNARFTGLVQRMQQRTLGGGAGEPIVVPMNPISMGLPLYPGAIPTQAPFAVVLGCSDARVPTEAVFDQSFNDLFVLRIAGNVLGAECLGSLHYAVRNLGDSLKLVVVLGHSKCGAVTAAVDTYLSPEAYVDIAYTYSLRSLVDQVLIAVRGAVRALEPYKAEIGDDADHYRSVLVAVAVYINAAVSAFELRREMKLRGEKGVEVVFAVYDFESLRIQCAPLPPEAAPRLRPAPDSPAELVAYANEVTAAFMKLDREERDANCRLTVKF
jgi:carbonic anhydrase